MGDEHTSGAGGRADKWSRGKSKGGQRAGAESRREHPSRSPSNNEQGLEGATWSQGLGLGLGGGHTWGALPLLTTRRRSAFTGTGITRFLAALQILAKDPLTVHTGAARGQGDARAQGSGMQTPPGVRVSHSWLLPHCALVLHTGLTSCLTHWKQPSFLPHTKPWEQGWEQGWVRGGAWSAVGARGPAPATTLVGAVPVRQRCGGGCSRRQGAARLLARRPPRPLGESQPCLGLGPGPTTQPKPKGVRRRRPGTHRAASEDADLGADGAARLAVVDAHAARKVELVAADALGCRRGADGTRCVGGTGWQGRRMGHMRRFRRVLAPQPGQATPPLPCRPPACATTQGRAVPAAGGAHLRARPPWLLRWGGTSARSPRCTAHISPWAAVAAAGGA